MRKMRKIITLAMTLVMMMAMSMTAFAATEATQKIVVNNLSAEEDTTVSIYKIAEINQDEWKFSDWVTDDMKSVDTDKHEYVFKYDDMKKAVVDNKVKPDDTKVTADGSTTLTFDKDIKAGAYLVLASGDKTEYQVMVAKTYTYNEQTSVFEAKSATVVAKTSSTIVTKTADDYFVPADKLVTFTIKTTVPYVAYDATNKEFFIYDQPTGLKNLALTEVKVGAEVVNASLSEKDNDGVYSVNLTTYLTPDNIGKEVVLTLTANVDGANGYTNKAWSNRMDPTKNFSEITGYTGSFTLTKVDAANTTRTLAGAKFSVAASKNGPALEFVKVPNTDGVYTLIDKTVSDKVAANDIFTELEVASDGTLKVQGLEEGTYYIKETQAPEGYSINNNIDPVEIKPEYVEGTIVAKGHVNLGVETKILVLDTTLISLPFTGGMGTTIFTILGVAIMAMAAALFFATKKSR